MVSSIYISLHFITRYFILSHIFKKDLLLYFRMADCITTNRIQMDVMLIFHFQMTGLEILITFNHQLFWLILVNVRLCNKLEISKEMEVPLPSSLTTRMKTLKI